LFDSAINLYGEMTPQSRPESLKQTQVKLD